jgi:hypothetical protein
LHPDLADEVVRKVKTTEWRGFKPPVTPYVFLLHAGRPTSAVIALVEVIRVERDGDCWAWRLGQVRPLNHVPCKGALSLWRPPPAVVKAVLEQLGRPAA